MVNIAMVNIKDTKRRERILNGNLTLTILTICAPIFFYNFFNSFYSIIDAVVVSKINSTSVSAVASLGQIKLLLSSLGAGIASGGGIIVARTFGAGDFDLAKKKSNQVISMSSILIGALLLICIPLAVPIMKFAKVPDELIAIGTGYFIVEIISLAFVFYNSVFMAMEKLGVRPEDCVFVGDTGMDVLAGVNAGAYPVGVLWGYREEAELIQNGAKKIISNPIEIANIVMGE